MAHTQKQTPASCVARLVRNTVYTLVCTHIWCCAHVIVRAHNTNAQCTKKCALLVVHSHKETAPRHVGGGGGAQIRVKMCKNTHFYTGVLSVYIVSTQKNRRVFLYIRVNGGGGRGGGCGHLPNT